MNIQDRVPIYLEKPQRPVRALLSHGSPAFDFHLRGLIYIPDWSIYVKASVWLIVSKELLTHNC